MLKDRSNCWN